MDIPKSCNQTSNWLNTSVTITLTRHIPAQNPMIGETQIGNHSGCSGIIVNEPVMIFMWSGISYSSALIVNWFVNVRCSEMIKSAGGSNWKVCLGLILEDRGIDILMWSKLCYLKIYHDVLKLVFSIPLCLCFNKHISVSMNLLFLCYFVLCMYWETL